MQEIKACKTTLNNSAKWYTTAVSLDVEKAFDSAWHEAILFKLDATGVDKSITRIVNSFFTDRYIQISIHNTLSNPVKLEAGTPQGSVLSPLLYLIYVNDIPLSITNGIAAGQYADDINSWASGVNQNRVKIKLQKTLDAIQTWSRKWRIKINPLKTQLITFKNSSNTIKLNINNTEIQHSSKITILGTKITIERSASLITHCKSKKAEAAKRTNLLRRLRGTSWGANSKTILKLYKQYIRPVLEYGAVALKEAAESAKKLLQIAETKALKTALKLPYRTKNKLVYQLAKITPINQRINELAQKAIEKFNSKDLENLEILKSIIIKS